MNSSLHRLSRPRIRLKFTSVFALLLSFLALCGVGFLLTTALAESQVVTFTVDSPLDEPDASPGDGTCASTLSGFCTLRAAIQEANALTGVDTIALPAGSFALTIPGRNEDLAATGDLDVLESVTIQGAGPDSTTITTNAIDRALQVFSPADITLIGMTIRDGDSGEGSGTSGGGIAVSSGSDLTLEDVTLSANRSGDSGGGIYNNGGTLVLRRVRILDNNAASAAGIRNSGSLSIYDTTIAGNHAIQTGGGILNTGSLTLEAVTVSGNIADTNGGGLYLHSTDPLTGLVSITNSTISGNQAGSFMGGGIWVYYQTELWVTNSTIASNTAGQGGGIFNYHQQGVLSLPSFRDATGTVQGGNIHLHNTLVAGNTFANCGRSAQTEPIHSLGHNLDSGITCEFIPALGDVVDTDPLLGMLQDNGGPTHTHALSAGSPAIDQADAAGCPANDQRGAPRPIGAGCDIGSFEYGWNPPAATATATSSVPTSTPSATPAPTVIPPSLTPRTWLPIVLNQ